MNYFTINSVFLLLFTLTLNRIDASPAASLPSAVTRSAGSDEANRPVLPLLTPTTTTTLPTYFSWNMQEYPNPQTNPKFCNRSSPSLLCDVDHLLTVEQANKLEQLMGQTGNVSRCYCKECPTTTTVGGRPTSAHGIQVAIALVRHIFRPYNSPQSTSQEFANHLRTEWKFGACDNTVLILLVADADEITLSVGAIADAVFDDKFFESLIGAHRNEFERGRFYEGLVSIIGGMRHHLISSKAPANLDHDAMMTGAGGATRTGGGAAQQPTPGSTTRTAVAVVGIIVGFLLVIFILTGTILLAKRRFEASANSGSAVEEDDEERPKPEGYWSGPRGGGGGDNSDDDDNDDRGTDQVDQVDSGPRSTATSPPPPPLPTTPPPSTPSQSPSLKANRKLSTPEGVVEYEPVSIEEDDHQQRSPEDETAEAAAAAAEIGEEELLEASSRISTPEVQRHSRL